MNKTIKLTFILNAIVIVLSLIITLLKGFTLISFINSLFTLSLTLFMLGLLMFVCRGGFFDAITFTFRKAFSSASKRAELLQADMKDLALPSDLFSSQVTYVFLFSGLLLTLLTTSIGLLL